MDDALELGKLVEVDSDLIGTLIKNNQYCTTWEIADTLKMSKSGIENVLYQLIYVYHFDVWVPHSLSEKTNKQTAFLTIYLCPILYLNVIKMFYF